MKRTLLVSIVLALVCFFSPGYSNDDEIVIGLITALTSSAAGDYVNSLQGVRLAVYDINRQGGILGKKIRLVEFDNKGTAIGSKQAAEDAVSSGVLAVIGPSYSSHSIAAAVVLQREGIPMISPVATSSDLTLVGDYIFRACFTDTFQGAVMASFARQDLKAKRAVVLVSANQIYSISLSDSFVKKFKESGGEIVLTENYLADSTDYSELIERIKKISPEVIFIPGYTKDSSQIIKQSRMMGIKSTFLGGDGWSDRMYDYAGNLIEGSYFVAHWCQNMPDDKTKEFVRAYKKMFGKSGKVILNSGSFLAYDSIYLLCDAIKRAGLLDRKKIRDELAATKNFKGITGKIKFDENRNPVDKSAVVLKFEKNIMVFVKTVLP